MLTQPAGAVSARLSTAGLTNRNWKRCTVRIPTVFAVVVMVAASSVAPGQSSGSFAPVTKEMLANPGPDDWLMYSRTYDAQRFSPLTQITRDNVGQLRPVFKKELGTGV